MTAATRLATLHRQLEHHYRVVLVLTEPLDLAAATFEIAAGRPSIAWCLGHLTHNVRTVPASVCDGNPVGETTKHELPHFGVASGADWTALLGAWRQATADALEGLAVLRDEDLSKPLTVEVHPAFRGQLTSRERFLHGHLFHVAWHAGQIGALRAAQGLDWPTP
ncbi:MAG: DinB family protein [Planctomycetota bacterium JB042]